MNKKIREPRLRFPGFEDEWEDTTLKELEERSVIEIKRGQVISKKDMKNKPGNYPVYSSSIVNKGYFGSYGDYMFDEEMITWSIDGGGDFFHRYKHKFSITNVSGYIRFLNNLIDCSFLYNQLKYLHSFYEFNYINKAHPSIIRTLYKISLPSLPEQKAIGSFFKTLDSLIENQEKYIEKMKDRKKGLLQDVFSKKIRMKDENGKEFEGEWEEVKLGEVSIRKPSKRTIKKSKDSKDSIYRYPLYNTTGIVGYKKDYDCDNAICIGKDGTIGKPFILSKKSSCVATIDYILNNKKSDLYFLYLYLSIMDFRIYAVGTTIKHIYYSDYKNHKISLPSLPEQKAIGRFFKTIDKKIEKEKELLEKYKMLKKALLQDMFI